MNKPTTTPATPNRFKPWLRWSSNLLLVAGLTALAICGFVWGEAHFFQAYEGRHLDLQVKAPAARVQSAEGNPVTGKSTNARLSLKTDSLIGKLKIDRLGISVVVLEGDEDGTLRIAAGHVPDTALPGQSGNVGIAAHRDTFFRPLRNIRDDDIITLETPEGTYQYKVQATWIVDPDHVEVLDPTPYPSLTLVTCYPFYYIGNAPHRFIVRARQISPLPDSPEISKVVGG